MPLVPQSRRRNNPVVYQVRFDGEYEPFYSIFKTKAAATYFARRVLSTGKHQRFAIQSQRLESALDIPEIIGVHFSDD